MGLNPLEVFCFHRLKFLESLKYMYVTNKNTNYGRKIHTRRS
jgi:hypothetical protein